MAEGSTGRPEGFGELVARHRAASGWSREELAGRMGVARVTVREAELGRDPRASTLQALARALPDCAPDELLPTATARVPPADAAAWSTMASAQGFVVQRLRRRLQPDSDGGWRLHFELTGVRPARGRFLGDEGLIELMRIVTVGRAAALRELWARDALDAGELIVVEDETCAHRFRVARGRVRGFSYSAELASDWNGDWPESEADARVLQRLGLGLAVDYPVRRLELWCDRRATPEGARPHAHAWPTALVPQPGRELLPALHGGSLESRPSGGSRHAVLAIDAPVVGLSYGIGWSMRPEPPPAPPSATKATLAERLRLGRERAELSRRGLAARMGMSAMTVVEAERGRDPRRSTLLRWLEALPDESPWLLLEGSESMSRRVAWRHSVAVHGCEAEVDQKTLRISAEGHSQLRIDTQGLRARRDFDQALRLRLGLARSVLQRTRATMSSVEAADGAAGERLRISRIPTEDGAVQHVLAIPSKLAEAGVSFGRRLEHRGVYVMRAPRARELTGTEGPFFEGTSFACLVPVRRLRLVVRVPRGWWPEDVKAHVWPLAQVPHPEAADAIDVLHPEGIALEVDRRKRRFVLEAEWPLVGFKYGLSWRLPEA